MKLIQRANKQLRIPDDKLDYYIGLGYWDVEQEVPEKPARKTKA